jgi:uncharacterized membrane protein
VALATVLSHLYRGEMARADAWRARLDNTTNWALTTTAAVVSFGLGSVGTSHAVFLVGMFLVVNFLLIETRRYRSWDAFVRRVRLLELGLYAPLLRDEPADANRLHELASLLEAPRILIPFWTALGQRARRAYGPVLLVLLVAWGVKLTVHHEQVRSLADFVDRAHVGFLPGGAVLTSVLVLYLATGALVVSSLVARPPATELLAARRRLRRTLREALQRPGMDRSPLSP